MCKCKLKQLLLKYDLECNFQFFDNTCSIIKANFTCLLCEDPRRKFASHESSFSWKNVSYFECNNCYNYIRIMSKCRQMTEKEYFFVQNYCVIMLNDKIILKQQNVNDIELPFFIFDNQEQLVRKIQTCINLL